MARQTTEPTPQEPLEIARELVSAVREPFLVLDSAARVLLASRAFYLEFDVPIDDAIGRPLYELGEGEWDLPELRSLLEERASGAEVVEGYEIEQRSRTHGRRRVRLDVRPLRRGSNRIHLYLVSLQVLHSPEPIAAEQAMPAQELHRLLTETSPDLVALHRASGDCLYVGTSGEALLGYSRGELLGLRPCELVHPHDAERLRETVEKADSTDSQRATVRMRRKSGEYAWLEITLRAVHDGSGERVLHSSSRDVTQRQRAEEALRWLSRQTKLILDSAAEGIFGLDPRGTVTFINPAAARLLGYQPADLLGRPYTTFARAPGSDPASDHPWSDPIGATLRDGGAREAAEEQFWRSDSAAVPVEFSCTAARDGAAVIGAVVTFRDITERRRAEEANRRSEWLAGVGQTVLALRHEINNPLTTLLAEASLLEIGGNSAEEEREMIGSIAEQARRIRDVVRRLTETQQSPRIREDGSSRMLDLS